MLPKQINITQPMLKGLQQLSPMPCHSTTGVGPEYCEGGYPQYCLPQNCKLRGNFELVHLQDCLPYVFHFWGVEVWTEGGLSSFLDTFVVNGFYPSRFEIWYISYNEML